jgi:exosortase C (VPDSG-CTERM-specific)
VAIIVILAFILPLGRLMNFAIHDELYSYILLIPFISGYLIWQEKGKLSGAPAVASRLTPVFLMAGLAALLWHYFARPAAIEDGLAQTTLAFLLFVAAAAAWTLGGQTLRALAFPIAFLIFMVPLPAAFRSFIEGGLQAGSAAAANVLFTVAATPMINDGLVFRLPGIQLEIAPECSGIHSTVVLFITSLLAGHYFLKRPWKRAVLCLAVIPLALLRNGFRVFVIGELCVHIGPQMINSVIHRHGGPLFFLLSLIPFFYLLIFLRKGDQLKGEQRNLTK